MAEGEQASAESAQSDPLITALSWAKSVLLAVHEIDALCRERHPDSGRYPLPDAPPDTHERTAERLIWTSRELLSATAQLNKSLNYGETLAKLDDANPEPVGFADKFAGCFAEVALLLGRDRLDNLICFATYPEGFSRDTWRGFTEVHESRIRNNPTAAIKAIGVVDEWNLDLALSNIDKEFQRATRQVSRELWLTVSDAAKVSGALTPAITRAANKNELTTNGETGRKRRISSVSLTEWILKRSSGP